MLFATLLLTAYTNHAGIAVAALPVRIERDFATLSNAAEVVRLPFSAFPESEQRRIAADYAVRTGDRTALRIPAEIRRAVEGNEKAVQRSRLRAEKGLCTKEESESFVEKSKAALKTYLDRQAAEGRLTETERGCLTR